MSKTEELQRIIDQHQQWLESGEQSATRADLSGASLDGVDLSGVDLSGAKMRGTSLNDSIMNNTQLIHADLRDASLRRANLSGANLLLADFTGADLTGADLSASAMASEKELGHVRRGPCFKDANLEGADLTGCYCPMSDFSGANVSDACLSGASLKRANLSNNNLSHIDFSGAGLSEVNFEDSNLSASNLTGANLMRANLQRANLSTADVGSADLRAANFADARVDGIRYDRKARFRGIRVANCYGSSRFRRYAQDQDYIEEIKEAQPVFYRFWLVLTDCGRSMSRVMLWSVGLTVVFGLIYFVLGEDAFFVSNKGTLGWSLFTTLYYSVVTFTTLGFGDVTPLTRLSATIVMIEVVVGYLMLGILISILATKVARRS